MDLDPRIDDAALSEQAPAIRAEVLRRLEAIWRSLAPRVMAGPDERLDPRFVDAGIRVLDRLMRLYRLDLPGQIAMEPMQPDDLRSHVAADLLALEMRLGLSEPAPERPTKRPGADAKWPDEITGLNE